MEALLVILVLIGIPVAWVGICHVICAALDIDAYKLFGLTSCFIALGFFVSMTGCFFAKPHEVFNSPLVPIGLALAGIPIALWVLYGIGWLWIGLFMASGGLL